MVARLVGDKIGWWQDWLVARLVGGKICWWQDWLVARWVGGRRQVEEGGRRRTRDAFKNENPHPVGGGWPASDFSRIWP